MCMMRQASLPLTRTMGSARLPDNQRLAGSTFPFAERMAMARASV